ncbi:MAG: hypothetical protein AB1777_12505 [Bacteroidota bacterium]
MKHLRILSTGILTIVIAFSACTKDEYTPDSIAKKENSNVEHGIKNSSAQQSLGIGSPLEDPYALKNMKKAYSNLKTANPSLPDIDIQPTHLYMRFLPSSEEEWNLLKQDESLILYDFPLNIETESIGTYYHDPSLPDSAITWQYCVVPIKHNIPNIHHELLYEVYIPDEDTNISKGTAEIDQLINDLEYESAIITGNAEKGILPSKWTPKGTIKVWDDIIGSTTTYSQVFDHWEYYDCDGTVPAQLAAQQRVIPQPEEQCARAVYRTIATTTQGRYIPLEGVSVHARWFTRIETDLTDANGYFEMPKFRFKVNYAIKWERSHYDIRNGMVWQAWYNGPKQRGDWNLNIKGGKSIMYATIHRAAYKHYYGDNLGINRPISNSKTKICYIDETGTGIFWGDWGGGILPDIKIWGKNPNTGNYKPTDEIFGTTAHELGHLSHWNFIGIIRYAQTSKTIYESWAEAVEWTLTNDEYHKMGAKYGGAGAIYYDCPYTNQLKWPFVNDKDYTPLFIDLIDNSNQRNNVYINGAIVHYGSISYPNDRISGYTLSYIQNNILRNSFGLSSLRDEIKKNKISGVTDADINELFALYW